VSSKLSTLLLQAHGIPKPKEELRFSPIRRWRFDYAWEEVKVAVELDGGVFCAGRHARGAGIRRDHEKINAAIELGWVVLRYLPAEVDYAQISRVIAQRKKTEDAA